MALSLMVLMAAATLAMTRTFAVDAQRTQNEVIDAQLRQLLLISAAAAQDQREGQIEVPIDDAQLTITYLSGRSAATIHATWRKRQAEQTLHFDEGRIIDIELTR